MLTKLFFNPYYVKVYKNKFIVKNILENNEVILTATQPFTTKRLLVGEFIEAEKLLTKALKQASKDKWYYPSPVVVIQPMEMAEGGLSGIELRAICELALGAGARKVVVWEGKTLTDNEVIENAKNT